MKISGIFLITCLASLALSAEYLFPREPGVRVRIINTLDTLKLNFSGLWSMQSVDLEIMLPINQPEMILFKGSEGLKVHLNDSLMLIGSKSLQLSPHSASATIGIADVPYGVGWWWAGREDRIYEGQLSIYLDDQNDLCVVVQLPLEQYLKGVVPYEIGPGAPPEALKAQAVAARSEAIVALISGLYGGDRHDLTSDVECQVFSGNHRRSPRSDLAVDETAGIILGETGEAIHAYYASNCGGHSELIENVWPDRPRPHTYLSAHRDSPGRPELGLNREWKFRKWVRSEPDVFCNPALGVELPSWSQDNFRWHREYEVGELTAMLAGAKHFGDLKRIQVIKRGASGRMTAARFIFEDGRYTVEGELNIRQAWKPSLRSAAFYIQKKDGYFKLHGAGWGHGVGMCQTGAIAMAQQEHDHRSILQHYYPAADLMMAYDTAITRDNGKWFVLSPEDLRHGSHHQQHLDTFGKYVNGYNRHILEAIDSVQATAMDGGGYFIGITADPPESPIGYDLDLFGGQLLDAPRSTSYCSGASYSAFIEGLNLILAHRQDSLSHERYEALRMQELDGGRREDGIRYWGKWNDDGYGNHFALVQYSEMGERIDPRNARPGDFMNISWKSGVGHSVVFLGWCLDANNEKCVLYWSSQKGTNGLGDQMVPLDRIREVVVVRLAAPENLFNFDIDRSVSRAVKGDRISW